MTTTPTTCANCRFSMADFMSEGECRRRAPVANQYGHAERAIVNPDDWCGEFEPHHYQPPGK